MGSFLHTNHDNISATNTEMILSYWRRLVVGDCITFLMLSVRGLINVVIWPYKNITVALSVLRSTLQEWEDRIIWWLFWALSWANHMQIWSAFDVGNFVNFTNMFLKVCCIRSLVAPLRTICWLLHVPKCIKNSNFTVFYLFSECAGLLNNGAVKPQLERLFGSLNEDGREDGGTGIAFHGVVEEIPGEGQVWVGRY